MSLMMMTAAALCVTAFGEGIEKGTVLDRDSSRIQRAVVRAVLANDPSVELAKAVTNNDGQFDVALPANTHQSVRWLVSAEGFEPYTSEPWTPGSTPNGFRIVLNIAPVATTVDVVAKGGEVSGAVTKSSIPLLETPQSISTVTREEILQRAPLNVAETLRYTGGVRTETYGFDARGDWSSSRGASTTQYVNGMRNLFGSYNNVRPEPFALEQIEVMRGPSSVLFGQGGFGGVVNLVSKRPLDTPRGEIQIQYGSFGRKQIGIDLTGPVPGHRETLQYRLIGVARDSGTQVNYVPDDRLLAAPSISWRPTRVTRLTLLGNFQEDRMGSSVGFFPWKGTLLPNPGFGQIHPSTFISEPGFDDYLSSARSGGYLFEHTIANKWIVRQNMNYSHSTVNYQSIYADFRGGLINGRSLNRILYINKPRANSPTIDTNVETRFRTGIIRHNLLAGYDFQQASITGQTASGTAPAIDAFQPVYGNYTVPRTTPFAKSRQDQKGVYAQDQLKFGESFSLLLGIRRDQATAETVGSPATRLDTTATTGRIGAVYTFSNGMAPYFSYTEGFFPIAGFNAYNQPFKPQRSKQYEAGVKHQAANGRILVTGALFDLKDTNRRTPDPNDARNQIQVGEAHSRGAELELRGRLPFSFDVVSSYTYNLVRISKSNSVDLGKRLSSMALHLGSIWFTRTWQAGNFGRIFIGPGIRYTGSSFDGTDSLRTPAYTLYDAVAALERGSWRFSINGSNLADKLHVTTCLSRGDCFYGMRRNVVGTVTFRF